VEEGRAVKDTLLKIVWFLLDRLKEPSTLSGIIKIVSAGGWHALDHTSRGELWMQGGLIVLGLIEILLPQRVQYKIGAPQ
jgi:hypothetical protein